MEGNNKIRVHFDGIDCTGKTSNKNYFNEKYPNLEVIDRGVLTKLTLMHWDLWEKPESLTRNWDFYIIFEIDVNEASRRAILREEKEGIKTDKFETVENLFLFRYRYRTLAAYYGNFHLVDITGMSFEQVRETCEEIIFKNCNRYLVPRVDSFSEEDFEKLPKIIEGESKIVREYNNRFNIIKYKPSVYSHKMQRAGDVAGTEKERMKMTKYILDIFSRHMINHTYWFVGENFILNEKLDIQTDIPPLEVIVKRCFVGSDKHRYYNMSLLKNRFGNPVVIPGYNEYQKLLVRFDFRNPNFHPETKQPIGDILVCDDLADEFINVEVAKKTAVNVFKCLENHFAKMNIYFEDVCLMLTVNGDKIYGEVSQDCGRYKYIKEDQLSDLDKDVWRAGGSSDLVLQKYQILSNLVNDYLNSLYEVDKITYA